MNVFAYLVSTYGMRPFTAISTPAGWLLLLLLAALPVNTVPAAATFEQACAPLTEPLAETDFLSAAEVPYSTDIFWRIEKGGIQPSYVFGTMHSQDRQVANLSSRQRLLLARSKRLLIEVVPDEEANQAYLDAMYSASGGSLKEELPAPLYERLGRIGRDYGIRPERLDELEPWAAFSQIGRPKPVAGPTQDIVIYQTAVQMGKPVTGLETMPELIETLASLPHDDQITILKDTICNHARIVRESKTLRDLYLAGDLAGMVAFNEQPHYDEAIFDRFMNAVLDQRNQRMFSRLRPYLEQGGNFIAVGALHLPGEEGLLQMIEQAGYSVVPLNSNRD